MSKDTQVAAHMALVDEYARVYGWIVAHRMARAKIEASARQLAEQGAPKLIGWRSADYTMETSDPKKAKNWAVHMDVLPIFEGDPNTSLAAARPLPAAPIPDQAVQRPQNCGTGFCSCIECPFDARAQKGTP